MTRPLKLGIVGAGFFGQVAHIANYAQLDSCEIVGLAQLRTDVREAVARKFHIPATYKTHHELLEQSDAEAIVVVTSRPAMGPIVLDCLNARKHVLSEKPMSGSIELAERLVDAAVANEVTYVVGYMKRHDAGVQRAKQLLDDLRASSELGQITYVRAHCFGGDAYCGDQHYIATKEQRSGGLSQWPMTPRWLPQDHHESYESYLNTFCHNINLVRFLLESEPTVTHAQTYKRTCVATLQFESFSGLLETGSLNHADWDEVTEIFFERGRMRITTPAPLDRNKPATVELYRGATATTEQIECAPSWSFYRQAEAFVFEARGDRDPIAPADDAVNDLRLTEAIWRKLLKIDE